MMHFLNIATSSLIVYVVFAIGVIVATALAMSRNNDDDDNNKAA